MAEAHKMALIIFIVAAVCLDESYLTKIDTAEVFSSASNEKKTYKDHQIESGYRRDMGGRSVEFGKGMSIEVPSGYQVRKLSDGEEPRGLSVELSARKDLDNDAQHRLLRPSTESTSTSTTTPPPVLPPLDPRYRRIYQPDESADITEYPFMAALLMNKQLWCGAAIVGSDKILTAAHCLQLQYNNRFFREYVKMLTVRVGSSNATAGGEVFRVVEIDFHPNYKPQSLDFNVAVLHLHKNLTLGRAEPVAQRAMYSREMIVPVDRTITFLGWGSVLGVGGTGGDVLLQKVDLPVYDLTDCQSVYGRDLVTRSNFCAGFITKNKNVCNHDAGGPAIMDGVLVGTLSFSSKRCDRPDQPAVFTSVGVIATWLDDVIDGPSAR